MKSLKYILVLLLITNFSCRDTLDDWFQDPPVSPVTQTIKTVVPVGYAASLVVMDIKGITIPNVKKGSGKSSKILFVDTNTDYPYKFKGDTYGQMIIAYIQTEVNTALVSVFFTDWSFGSSTFSLENVVAFPITFTDDKITAVYASMDINLGIDIDDLTPNEIDEEELKLNNKPIKDKSDVNIALAQNAWIIEIYHQGTFDNYDDILTEQMVISGGQQAIAVEDYNTESSAGVLQMVMIAVDYSFDCLKNPTSGYVFLQDVELESSTNDADIVFGHVFYEFTPSCDGQILVDVATGNFIFAIGDRLNLDLI